MDEFDESENESYDELLDSRSDSNDDRGYCTYEIYSV